MRLQRYINEGSTTIFKGMDHVGEAIDLVKKDCKPYIKLVKSARRIAIRHYSKSTDFLIKLDVRSGRLPVDTSIEIHNEFDDLFKKKFGWKVRSNGAFTWVRPLTHITTAMFFPIGKFDYIWSPIVQDLYTDYAESDETQEDYTPEEIVDSYKMNKGFKDVRQQEVVWKCKSYYLMRPIFPTDKNASYIIQRLIEK